MEQHQIQLILPDLQIIPAFIHYDEDADDCQLHLIFLTTTLVATQSDYFEAFCSIRKQLEAQGIMSCCYGASRNVYPSGMARDMAQGLKAYKLILGQSATTKDLVDIFDNAPDVIPATVAEQQAYFETWLEGFRKP